MQACTDTHKHTHRQSHLRIRHENMVPVLLGNSLAASKHIKRSCNHTLFTAPLSPTDGQFILGNVFTSPWAALKFHTRADATSPRSAIEFN